MTPDAPIPGAGARVARALRQLFGLLLRLLFVLVLAVALAFGVYSGLPRLYARLVQPTRENSARIAVLSARLEALQKNTEGAAAAQAERLTALEIAGDDLRQRLSTAEARTDDLRQRLSTAETGMAGLQTGLDSRADENRQLEAQVAGLGRQLTDLSGRVDHLESAVSQLPQQQPVAVGAQEALQTEIALLRARNTLLDAQVQLAAQNLGELRLRLPGASDQLFALIQTLEALTPESRTALAARLAAARGLFQDQPAAALDELLAVWRQLDLAAHPAATSTPG